MALPQPESGDRPSVGYRPDQAVIALMRRPYVAEILAALDERPHSLASLYRTVGAPRRLAVDALRALAAHQAVTRQDSGTWDTVAKTQATYQISGTGRALIDYLFDLDVWLAVYDIDPSHIDPSRD
ncbi:hypothetical protein GCM10023322_45080 [Rugosimonospora acidiphila]|uniref:Transcriptional regulator n=1 Tax=Rugosimonospora acidiphila TaxID=556531 RepID=A0ABP9S377_9ACTN